MSDEFDPLGAMLGDEKPTPAPVESKPEAEPAKEPAAEAGQPRDPHGRFASTAEKPETPTAEAAPVPVAEAPPPAPQKSLIDPEQFKGYLDEKEKRKAIQAERDKLAAELKALREQQAAQPFPSFQDDPEGHVSALRQQFEQRLLENRFASSEDRAREKHGDDLVTQAMDWGMDRAEGHKPFEHRSAQGQAFTADYTGQRHPIDWIVKAYKRDQLLSQIGDKDPKEWARELLAAEQSPQPSPAASQPITSPTPQSPPTPSLATARSAGGMHAIPLGGDAAFEAMFQK